MDGGPPDVYPGGKSNLLPWRAYERRLVAQGHNEGSHTGQFAWAWDFAMPVGTPVLAAHDGRVTFAKGDSTRGGCNAMYFNDANFVIIEKERGLSSAYGHLSAAMVKVGQVVKRGDLVGLSGQTGFACGPHLHFHFQDAMGVTLQGTFHDTGQPWDPPKGSQPESRNGVLDLP
jgi:murein DD-endopeptidase MepM/ murein hydrolase activator NlpD